jgi:uncharacterized integral membrane protein (TIGR00697 family)
MLNELLFVAVSFIDIIFVYWSFRLGREWLAGTIAVNLILISLLGAKVISLFGFITNIGNPFFACVFFATQLFFECYGKERAYRLLWFGVGLVSFFMLMSHLATLYAGVSQSAAISQLATALFAFTPRIMIASLLAFSVSQYVHITLYKNLREHSEMKETLWMRSMTAVGVGQLVDSVLFFSLAFVGRIPFPLLIPTILAGWILKSAVGAMALPFLKRAETLGFCLSKRPQK